MKITLFKSIRETKTPMHVDIDEVLKRIKEGKVKDLIHRIRKERDKAKRQELKKQLPSICFSGTFRERSANKIITHSGFICLDFDNFPDNEVLTDYVDQFKKDQFTYSCFISPSGNGIKVIVKIPNEKSDHKRYFKALEDYYDCEYFDKNCSDVSRVCFISYDPNIYVNKESVVFIKKDDIEEHKYASASKDKIPLKNETAIIQRLEKWWNKKYSFTEGNRNDSLFVLACAFSEYGIAKYSCESYFTKFQREDFKTGEINQTIESAYKKTVTSFNSKFFENYDIRDYVKKEVYLGTPLEKIKEEVSKKGYDQNELDDVIDEEAQNADDLDVYYSVAQKTKRVTIYAKRFKEFLQMNGFYRYQNNDDEEYRFIRIENNLVSFITVDNIKDFVLKDLDDNGKWRIYEFFADSPKYFKKDFLNILDIREIPLLRDTKRKAYFFYSNCIAIVTPEGIKTIDYLDLEDGYVFKKRINKRSFEVTNNNNNDFKTFIKNVSGNNKVNEQSFRSTIGYLLHGYKDSSKSPAVILNDECISENPEGGTGKGIFTTALEYLRRSVVLDGKLFNIKEKFAFQTVTPETQIIAFDDIKKNFPFESLFSVITQGITLEYKNVGAKKVDFKDSPKIIISTNYTVKGDGNSHDRRKWELEFSQYYHRNKTPEEEFGRQLFYDWNDNDWLLFDNYMLGCVQFYFENNCQMISPEFKNLKLRKFMNQTSMEFYQWAEDDQNEKIRKSRVAKAELFEDFTSEYTDFKRWLSRKTFLGWLRKYAELKGLSFEQGNSQGIRWVDLGYDKELTDTEIKELGEVPF